jgi:NADH-quinone oxidoreductase subunit C
MTNGAIKEYITAHAPEATYDETSEWLNIVVEANQLIPLANVLYGQPMQLDFLFCLTCVDYKTQFTMVYHLTASTNRNMNIVIKVNVDRSNPVIETVSTIWRTAEFHEREVFEMFGVQFTNHPDLRKLILEDDFKGWPLRKDFEDPINMIKL